jgi:hypothetical protein
VTYPGLAKDGITGRTPYVQQYPTTFIPLVADLLKEQQRGAAATLVSSYIANSAPVPRTPTAETSH